MASIESAAEPMRELALFAGAGGGILGGKLLGWRCVCAVERDPYAASDLAALGYDAEWGVLGAHHAGAPHERERIWIVAGMA